MRALINLISVPLLLISATIRSGEAKAAGEVMVAVANNFYRPLLALAEDYEKLTGHTLLVSTGSTGQLYAQIVNGAPFEVFLAADRERPEKLVQSELASGAFTYATGRMVLWSSDADRVRNGSKALQAPDIRHIAMANPKLAPYGKAAVETMKALGLYQDLKLKLVEGKGLSTAFQFVLTGNAELGFLALSQICDNGTYKKGSYWLVPERLHQPIYQDAVLLKSGVRNPVAGDFMQYLASDRAKSLIGRYGYQ